MLGVDIKSRAGKTPEEVAQSLCSLDVYRGVTPGVRQEMTTRTLSGRKEATISTVLCFTQEKSRSDRERALVKALRGFIDTRTPDFTSLLQKDFPDFDTFVTSLKKKVISQIPPSRTHKNSSFVLFEMPFLQSYLSCRRVRFC